MRIVIQRVSEAGVSVKGKSVAEIEKGLLIFLGIEDCDAETDADWLVAKLSSLRIFSDDAGLMNCSVQEAGGSMMVVSQFTLHAKTRKGSRPSFIKAARPEKAIPLYEYFVDQLRAVSGVKVSTGEFGAMMNVSLVNDGPVTIIVDSQNRE